jgi:hypothetical protein
MSGRGRTRGSHMSSAAVANTSLPGSADTNLIPNAERMNTLGSENDDEMTRQREVSEITEWTGNEEFVDTDPDEAYMSAPSRTVVEKHTPVTGSTQGDFQMQFASMPAQHGGEGVFNWVPNADSDSTLAPNSRVLAPGLRSIKKETLESHDTVADPDLVCLSQRYRPRRLADTDKSENVTPRRRKRTELEMLNL